MGTLLIKWRGALLSVAAGLLVICMAMVGSESHGGATSLLTQAEVRSFVSDTTPGIKVYDGTHNVDNFGIPEALRGKLSPDCAVLPRKDCLPQGTSREWRHGDPIVREPMGASTGGDANTAVALGAGGGVTAISAAAGASGDASVPPAIIKAFQRANKMWDLRHPSAGRMEGASSTRVKVHDDAKEGRGSVSKVVGAHASIMQSVGASEVPQAFMNAFKQAKVGAESKSPKLASPSWRGSGEGAGEGRAQSQGEKSVLTPSLIRHLKGLENTLVGEISEIRTVLGNIK